ncbi:MAG: lipopolysaccharide transport periplasmic protein LptA [Proteobacteria bacterium]|nr:lipopolysaccharide transport periplasmic protein LptA [Pseudomonadota bacterium]
MISNRHCLLCLFGACVFGYGQLAIAAEQDATTNGELTIEGDSAVFLQSRNRIEYSGNVIAYMNGMRISGDKVLVQMNDDRVEQITTSGSPANFWQDVAATDSDTEAEAQTIIYLPNSGLLELSGSASLSQNGNAVHSASIRYNLTLGQLEASGDQAQERVRMQLFVPNDDTTRDSTSQ